MLTLLKLVRSLIKTLHSDGSPAQIAVGVALGAALGLTPLMNAHNLLVLLLLAVLNVSFAAGMLAWAVFVPIGLLLDPVFDRVGHWLLVDSPALRPMTTLPMRACHRQPESPADGRSTDECVRRGGRP